MLKWYEDVTVDDSVFLSSRVRLARNLKKYPFALKLNSELSSTMIDEVKSAVINDRNSLANTLTYDDLSKTDALTKQKMMENHLISPVMLDAKLPCGVIKNEPETISIMLNEEDHIRIQTIVPSKDISNAYFLADNIDTLIEETLDYAFDYDFGYLTSCPSNTGTGLRASFMLHLPMLSETNQIKGILDALSKLGMTIRGIHGEGSESLGHIYQISNQTTLGKSEKEIINNLVNVTNQVIDKENYLRDSMLKNNKFALIDKVMRSYGTLKNARIISSKEAMECLSFVRLGYNASLIEESRPATSIYSMMININPASLAAAHKDSTLDVNNAAARDILRAAYLRECFH